MTSQRVPIHRRINWPDGTDIEMVALGIYRGLYAYFDATGLNIDPIRKLYESHRYYFSNDAKKRMAALWYAVMRTAIETYGLKA